MIKLRMEFQPRYIRKKPFQKALYIVKTRALDIATSEEFKLVSLRLIQKGISTDHFVNHEQNVCHMCRGPSKLNLCYPTQVLVNSLHGLLKLDVTIMRTGVL
jgi:hypothetical protein